MYKLVNGVQIQLTSEEIAAFNAESEANNNKRLTNQYKRLRSKAYPSIGDQLDMLYHDFKNGTSTWTDTIEAIKTQFPK